MDKTAAILFLALVALVRSHDYKAGIPNGVKVYDEKVVASPALWRQVQNVTITINGTEVISGIVVTDLRPDKDGEVRIVEGGEGENNVTLELKSPTVLRGYEFQIEIYVIESNVGDAKKPVPTQDANKPNIHVPLEPNFVTKEPLPTQNNQKPNSHTLLKPIDPAGIHFDKTTKHLESSTKLPNPVEMSTDLKVNDHVRHARHVKETSTTPKTQDSTTFKHPVDVKDDISHSHATEKDIHSHSTTTEPQHNKHESIADNSSEESVEDKTEDHKLDGKLPSFPLHNDKVKPETEHDKIRGTRDTKDTDKPAPKPSSTNQAAVVPSTTEGNKAIPVVPSLFKEITAHDSTTAKSSSTTSSTASSSTPASSSTTSKPNNDKETNLCAAISCVVTDASTVKSVPMPVISLQ